MAQRKKVARRGNTKRKSDEVCCPKESVSGVFTEEFGTDAAGAAAAAAWLQKTRKYIDDNFKDWCEYDPDCPKTLLIVRVTSATVPPSHPGAARISYTMTFKVICTDR